MNLQDLQDAITILVKIHRELSLGSIVVKDKIGNAAEHLEAQMKAQMKDALTDRPTPTRMQRKILGSILKIASYFGK